MFFAGDVVNDLTFKVRNNDSDINGFGLPEPVAPPNCLVVRLVTVRQSEEDHAMAVLEVHSEPRDLRLGDEHANGAVLERFERRGLVIRRP